MLDYERISERISDLWELRKTKTPHTRHGLMDRNLLLK